MHREPEPTVAEFRALMLRTPEEGDRCTCGAQFHADSWTNVGSSIDHFRCYARYREPQISEAKLDKIGLNERNGISPDR